MLAMASAVFCLATASAAAPTGDPVRHGLRGLRRAQAMASNELWRTIEPMARWIGRRTRGWLSEEFKASVDHKIEMAGDYLGLVPEEFVGLSCLWAIGGAGFGMVLGSLSGLSTWATLGGVLYGAFGPSMMLSKTAGARLDAISRRLPHSIDLLALSVSAGLDFPGATRQVIDKSSNLSDPLIEELSLLLQSIGLGHTRRQALTEFARRCPCVPVLEFVSAMIQAELRGTPVAEVLRIQADTARLGRSNAAEELAAKAGVKLLLPLGLIFLCVLTLVVAPIVIKVTSTHG